MGCCSSCIGDRGIEIEIFPLIGTIQGICDYCRTSEAELIEERNLQDHFETIISAYIPDENGKKLAELLKVDWLLFPSLDIAQATILLGEILDDGEIIRTGFSPKSIDGESGLRAWELLRTELKHGNRYFPKTNIDKSRLNRLLSYIMSNTSELPTDWFRARAQVDDAPYSPDDMGAPPKRLASHGRANPAGIPYLYIASDAETAVSEIRPHTGELISIAQFHINESLNFIDLRNPRKLVSPFMLENEDEVALLRRDISFLELLGKELRNPVLPQGAAIDYVPSQYLCEFIKNSGFDGVIYDSSVGEGMNLALFDPSKGTPTGGVICKKVDKVTVETGDPLPIN